MYLEKYLNSVQYLISVLDGIRFLQHVYNISEEAVWQNPRCYKNLLVQTYLYLNEKASQQTNTDVHHHPLAATRVEFE